MPRTSERVDALAWIDDASESATCAYLLASNEDYEDAEDDEDDEEDDEEDKGDHIQDLLDIREAISTLPVTLLLVGMLSILLKTTFIHSPNEHSELFFECIELPFGCWLMY